MNVGELRAALAALDDNMEVLITDGYRGLFYRGEFLLQEFEITDGQFAFDIGIGGCDEEEV